VSLAFLTPSGPPAPESPLAAAARRAGGTLEVRDGWLVAVRFSGVGPESAALAETVGWGDASPRGKFELRAPAGSEPGVARCEDGCWRCPVTPGLTLVLADTDRAAVVRARLGEQALDVTTQYGALVIAGPLARETIARFCAIDLRGAEAGGFHPGSVARTPGYLLCEAPERYLVLFGAAVSEYMWTVVSDAGRSLGGRPAGWGAIAAPPPGALASEAARA
jgi:glycine cleavage system aminomethyltransferase T